MAEGTTSYELSWRVNVIIKFNKKVMIEKLNENISTTAGGGRIIGEEEGEEEEEGERVNWPLGYFRIQSPQIPVEVECIDNSKKNMSYSQISLPLHPALPLSTSAFCCSRNGPLLPTEVFPTKTR